MRQDSECQSYTHVINILLPVISRAANIKPFGYHKHASPETYVFFNSNVTIMYVQTCTVGNIFIDKGRVCIYIYIQTNIFCNVCTEEGVTYIK